MRSANGTTVPATGPYVVETYTEGKEIVLARNPRFSSWDETVRPDGFPDQIVWRLGTDIGQMAAKVLHGDADLMFTLPEPKSSARLASNRAGQLQLAPQPGTFFMSLDTHAPPFDDPRVRRALNFAVDRLKVQELIGYGTRPACQVMPPNFPGYVPYCPYTRQPGETWTAPDLKEAHQPGEGVGHDRDEGDRVDSPQLLPAGRPLLPRPPHGAWLPGHAEGRR